MKKFLAILLVVVLTAGISVGATLAYLTDTDAQVNTFTNGNVYIDLWEDFGDNDDAGIEKLLPAVTATDGSIRNAVEKEVYVTNTGSEDAYVRVHIAIPTRLVSPDELLHVVRTPGTDVDPYWNWATNTAAVEIDEVDYTVYTLTYGSKLAPDEVTVDAIAQVYLDGTVDNDKINALNTALGSEWKVYVCAQAAQTEGFDSAKQALTTAFGDATQVDWEAVTDGTVNVKYTESVTIDVEGGDKAAVLAAIEAANPGDAVILTEDTTIAGFAATEKLVIDKPIILDLGGNTLTTECGWGGIDLKNGASIRNGTINHTGNTAAIKAFQVGSIENLTINVTETDGKTKGGIVVQEGAGCYVGSIKNVTIKGATNGIETYRCGQRDDLAIGSMSNVSIEALDNGLLLSAPVGTATNCSFKGNNIGINAYLYGPYSVSLKLVGCTVSGATAVYAHDEAGQTNPGSMTLSADAATTITGTVTKSIEAEAAPRVSITGM